MGDNTSTSLVNTLRQRSVEEDLSHCLKGSVGGYTKKSVTEYVSALRRQQLSYAETFNRNMQTVLDEKEELKKETSRLNKKIARLESEYKALTDSMRVDNLEQADATLEDIPALKDAIAALTAENDRLNAEARTLDSTIKNQQQALSEKDEQISEAERQTRNQMELLTLEKKETVNLRTQVAQEARYTEELEAEIARLKNLLSEDHTAALSGQVAELREAAKLSDEIIERHKTELSQKNAQSEALTNENLSLRAMVEGLKQTLGDLTLQNEKLAAVNLTLSDSLEAEGKRIVELLREKSEQTVEKLVAERRLESLRLGLTPSADEQKQESEQGPEAKLEVLDVQSAS